MVAPYRDKDSRVIGALGRQARWAQIAAEAQAINAAKIDLPPHLANKGTRLIKTPRAAALGELLREADKANIVIQSDDEARALLDWAAKREGVDPSSYHAVTIGDVVMVRPEHAGNVRILREEFIHVFQQRAGQASNEVIKSEIQARWFLIKFRHTWGITNEEVREMAREIRQMEATGRY